MSEGAWQHKGTGPVRIVLDPARNRRSVEMRCEKTGFVRANFIAQFQLGPVAKNAKTWTVHGMVDEGNGTERTIFLFKFKDSVSAVCAAYEPPPTHPSK